MTDALDQALARAKVFHLQPDDLLIMSFPGVDMDAELMQQLAAALGDRRVIVVADDAKVCIVEGEEP